MKFSCEKALLQKAISTVHRAVAVKSTVPALEGILLEVGSCIKMTGYNLKIGITTTLSADIQEEGQLVLSARIFNDIVRKMPDDIIVISSEKGVVNLKSGTAEFHISSIDAVDFPSLPEEKPENSFSIEQKTLKEMISQSLFAVSLDETRPIYTGSLFEVNSDNLTIVSVDGFRLALRKEKIQTPSAQGEFSFVVLGEALTEVEKICEDTNQIITIAQGDHFILFQTEEVTLVSRKIEGEFLNYRASIPSENHIHVLANTKEMLEVIDRVSLIINENNKSPLRCRFGKDTVQITTRTAIGDATDECRIMGDGQDLEIGFNNRYLMDALKNAPGEKIKINLNSSVAPCLMLPAEENLDNFLYMVLPVRLKAGT